MIAKRAKFHFAEALTGDLVGHPVNRSFVAFVTARTSSPPLTCTTTQPQDYDSALGPTLA